MSPETPPEGLPVTVAGLDMSCKLPPGVLPVRALVVIECMCPEDQDASSMLWWSATSDATSWWVHGVTDFVANSVKGEWDSFTQDHGGEEEE